MAYYQNQPLDLSCHKNRPLSPPLFAVAAAVVPDRPLLSQSTGAAAGRCFRRRPVSSSDNDDDEEGGDDRRHHHHPSPDSAVDAGREPRRRSLGSSDEPFTDRSRSRSPGGDDDEEDEEATEQQYRSFGYDIGPRKRFLSKFFTEPQGKYIYGSQAYSTKIFYSNLRTICLLSIDKHFCLNCQKDLALM